jgi:hypothetical protein
MAAAAASPSLLHRVLLTPDAAASGGGGSGGGGGGARGTTSTDVKEGSRRIGTPTGSAKLPAATPVASRVAGTRMLVVDDSEANRRFAAFIARKLGCAVTAVGDGDEVVAAVAAAAAAGAPYDIVFMDLVMVRCQGAEASAAICPACCRLDPIHKAYVLCLCTFVFYPLAQ